MTDLGLDLLFWFNTPKCSICINNQHFLMLTIIYGWPVAKLTWLFLIKYWPWNTNCSTWFRAQTWDLALLKCLHILSFCVHSFPVVLLHTHQPFSCNTLRGCDVPAGELLYVCMLPDFTPLTLVDWLLFNITRVAGVCSGQGKLNTLHLSVFSVSWKVQYLLVLFLRLLVVCIHSKDYLQDFVNVAYVESHWWRCSFN